MCTAMLFDPVEAEAKIKAAELAKAEALAAAQKVAAPAELEHEHAMRHREFKPNQKLFERWMRFKQFVLLKSFRKKEDNSIDPSPRRKSLLGIFFW
jgi:hypothetical protein